MFKLSLYPLRVFGVGTNQDRFTIQHAYLLEDYTEQLAAAHGIKNYTKVLTLDYLEDLADSVLGDQRRSWEDTND